LPGKTGLGMLAVWMLNAIAEIMIKKVMAVHECVAFAILGIEEHQWTQFLHQLSGRKTSCRKMLLPMGNAKYAPKDQELFGEKETQERPLLLFWTIQVRGKIRKVMNIFAERGRHCRQLCIMLVYQRKMSI
jgi:hypothetical protein